MRKLLSNVCVCVNIENTASWIDEYNAQFFQCTLNPDKFKKKKTFPVFLLL